MSKLQGDVDIAERPERVQVLNVYVLPVDVVIRRIIYSFIVVERVGTTSVCHSKVPELLGTGGVGANIAVFVLAVIKPTLLSAIPFACLSRVGVRSIA